MKKGKFYLLIVVLFTILTPGKAQDEFFKPGAEWYYGFESPGLLPARGYTQYKYMGDTTITGHQLKKLTRTTFTFDLDNPTIPLDTFYSLRYYKQSADSILHYHEGDLTLLWIIGLEQGESFQIDEGWDSTDTYDVVTMVVDSTKDIALSGVEVRETYLHGGVINVFFGDTFFISGSGDDMIYDKFGPAGGFGYWTCWSAYDCYTPSLCRYVSDETGVIDIPTGYNCETLTTSSNEIIPKRNLIVYPNPATDYLIVELSDVISGIQLEIFYSNRNSGFQCPNVGEKNQIDISSLSPGIFFCKLTGVNGSSVVKVVKVN